MFWLRNKKVIFSYALLSGGLKLLIKALIRLCECAGWSALLFLEYNKVRFSCEEVQIRLSTCHKFHINEHEYDVIFHIILSLRE